MEPEEPAYSYTVFNEAEELGNQYSLKAFLYAGSLADLGLALRAGVERGGMESSAMNGCWQSKCRHIERGYSYSGLTPEFVAKAEQYCGALMPHPETQLAVLKLLGKRLVPSQFALSAWRTGKEPYGVQIAKAMGIRCFNLMEEMSSWIEYHELLIQWKQR